MHSALPFLDSAIQVQLELCLLFPSASSRVYQLQYGPPPVPVFDSGSVLVILPCFSIVEQNESFSLLS